MERRWSISARRHLGNKKMIRTKTVKLAVIILLTAWQLISTGMRAHAAGREVDTSFFYERLAPQGQWFKHATYGWA